MWNIQRPRETGGHISPGSDHLGPGRLPRPAGGARTRYTVESLLELLVSGMTIDDVLEDHPDLERDDLLAVLEFGALAAGQRRVVPLGAA